jgi:glycosidase
MAKSRFSMKDALQQIAFSALTLGNRTVYQVNVRNYSAEGTFKALEKDLDRIKGLHVDYIQLLPIHPIGVQNRKGTLGSPYAISNYRAINPELGKEQDFYSLVQQMHRRGMGCIMDMVLNHTSPDSILAIKHPGWFYKNEKGEPRNRIAAWTDVVDLDYGDENSGLWDYQIETLKMWARIVDGFRCDVAALVPIEFWESAREAVGEVNPRCIWIAESVEPSFIVENRARGYACHSDCELYRVFNVCYDYDIFADFKKCAVSSGTEEFALQPYVEALNRQLWLYPENFVKLRFLENHDQDRAAALFPEAADLWNWTAFTFFQKGLALIHAGQETADTHRPSLFEKDTVTWEAGDNHDIHKLLACLAVMRKDPLFLYSFFQVRAAGSNVLVATHSILANEIVNEYENNHGKEKNVTRRLIGVFGFHGTQASIDLNGVLADIPGGEAVQDGVYLSRIDGPDSTVKNGKLDFTGEPIIFEG